MEISNEGALKTHIMFKAKLSFNQLNMYLKRLAKLNLIEKNNANGKEIYTTTAKGLNFLQRHREMIDALNENLGSENCVKTPPPSLLRRNNLYFTKISSPLSAF